MTDFENCMNPPIDDGLADKVREMAEKMADCIRNGNSVEVHPAKDGIKVFEVKKKLVRWLL